MDADNPILQRWLDKKPLDGGLFVDQPQPPLRELMGAEGAGGSYGLPQSLNGGDQPALSPQQAESPGNQPPGSFDGYIMQGGVIKNATFDGAIGDPV